ncbi:MAG: succinate dehydrogenase cytochrome b subunit [Chthoniobacter sp.]|nr:succinate dehydrogenase cytochrome b subunit [Chthoniobacter sp.]
MNPLLRFCSSSIGRKWIVALTGLVLFGFVIGHLIGNLQVFLGSSEPINRYGAFLQGLGELLWAIRLGLLAMLVLHIVFTIKLRAESRAARGVNYAVTERLASPPAARWMLLSGLMVLCFIIFHLLHFTVQVPAVNMIGQNFETLHDAQGRHDVYRMMILGFSNPVASAFYVVAVALLALHLNHGIMSMFQTLGLNSAKVRPLWEKGGPTLAWLIFLGYASIPVAVLTGIVK